MSQFEKKQFLLSRVERSLDISIEGWKNFYESFENLSKALIDANKRERNPLVVGCGAIVPILFGLVSLSVINTEELQFYLSVDITIAIIIFLGYGIYNLYLTKTLLNPDHAIIKSISYLDALRHSFAITTFELEKLSEDDLKMYLLLTILSDGSNKIRIKKELVKISKKKWSELEIRKNIDVLLKEWQVNIDDSVKAYHEVKNELDKDKWKNFQFLIQEVKDYKKGF